MVRARDGSPGRTARFIAVLACKENLSLLLAIYCAVHLIVDRTGPGRSCETGIFGRWFFNVGL